LAECKRLGWCIVGPDGASATASFRNDALTRQGWLDGDSSWGLEPALAVVTRRQRSGLHTTLYLTIRVPWATERWFVGSSASPAIVLIQGEPLITQLAAAIARLESAWTRLCPALPVWRQETVPAREIDGARALLDARRPLPPARPAPPSSWHSLSIRFANHAGRFIDHPSPYAAPEAPAPTSLGLPGNWDRAGSRADLYLRRVHECAFGGINLATGRKRPHMADGSNRIALLQAIWDLVLGDPALASIGGCRPTRSTSGSCLRSDGRVRLNLRDGLGIPSARLISW
jgi:hypothetical protein